MAKSYIEKMEEAAGITPPAPRPATVPVPAPMPSPRKQKTYGPGRAYPISGIPLVSRAKGGPVSPGKSKIMRMKGSALSGFMPGPKKSKKGKKRSPKFPV